MKTRNKIFIAVLIIGLVWAFLNIPVYTRKGINYTVIRKQIPLYIKAINFISRDFEYKRLVKEIVSGKETDQEKILAIFDWAVLNVKHRPDELAPVDDHVLNIIIRGYGTIDQLQDAFSTLCSYAGYPATMYKIFTADDKTSTIVSYVYFNGQWRILDVYNNFYFKDGSGSIASIEYLIKNPLIIDAQSPKIKIHKYDYSQFFKALKQFKPTKTLRPKLQMPVSRFFYEVGKLFNSRCGIEKPR